MGEWKRVNLGEICSKIGSGATPTGGKSAYKDNGVSLIRSQNVLDMSFTMAGLAHIDDEQARKLDGVTVCGGDVLLNITGDSVARCCIVPNHVLPARVNQHVCIVRPRLDLAESRFVEYFLVAIKDRLLTLASAGATRNALTKETIQNLEVDLPPLPTQRRIAAVLGALDDKIEVNRKICENLEAQAQALFKAWFVDFEPFKGVMVNDSVWGEHPKELEYVRVGDLNPVLETGSRPKGGAATSGIPSIGAENVKLLGVFDFGSKKYIPEEFAQKLKRGKIHGYELLLYKDGGKPGMFKPHFSMFGEGFPYEECYINEHVFKVDFGSCETNVFAYFYFKSQYVFNWLETNGAKAAIPGINQANVLDVMMPNPEHVLVKQFGEKVLPAFKMIFTKCKESHALAAMRDALLPKLMSGELAVEKVEVMTKFEEEDGKIRVSTTRA